LLTFFFEKAFADMQVQRLALVAVLANAFSSIFFLKQTFSSISEKKKNAFPLHGATTSKIHHLATV